MCATTDVYDLVQSLSFWHAADRRPSLEFLGSNLGSQGFKPLVSSALIQLAMNDWSRSE